MTTLIKPEISFGNILNSLTLLASVAAAYFAVIRAIDQQSAQLMLLAMRTTVSEQSIERQVKINDNLTKAIVDLRLELERQRVK